MTDTASPASLVSLYLLFMSFAVSAIAATVAHLYLAISRTVATKPDRVFAIETIGGAYRLPLPQRS